MAKPPYIFWHWQNLPANSDVVSPLGRQELQGKEMWLFYNHTQQQFMFEYDGYYGTLMVDPDDEEASNESTHAQGDPAADASGSLQ